MKSFRRAAILAGILCGGSQAIRLKDKRIKAQVEAKETCSGGKENSEGCSAAVADNQEAANGQDESLDESTKKSTSKQGAGAKKLAKETFKNSVAAKVGSQQGMLASAKTNLSALHEMATSIKIPGEDYYREYIGSKSIGVQLAMLGIIGMTVALLFKVAIVGTPRVGTPRVGVPPVFGAFSLINCMMMCCICKANSFCKACALYLYSSMPCIIVSVIGLRSVAVR